MQLVFNNRFRVGKALVAVTVGAVVTTASGGTGKPPIAVCDWSVSDDVRTLPTDLNSLLVWFDASSLDARDGESINVWPDMSGNGHDAMSASAQPPFYKASAANGMPTVGFGQQINRSDPRFMNVDFGANHTPGPGPAAFAVLTIPQAIPNATRVGVVWGNYQSNPNYNVELHTNGRTRWYWNNGQRNLFGTADTRHGTPVLVTWYRNASLNRIESYVNGNADIINGVPGTTLTYGSLWRLGYDFRTSGDFVPLIGDIAEFVLYDRALLNSERMVIEAYLAAKYGIPQPYRRIITLDGSQSSDPTGLDLAYQWALNGEIVGVDAIATVLLGCGTYEAVLTVTNTEGASHQCSTTIEVLPARPGDLNCDGRVDVLDLLILLGAWGNCPKVGPCPADLNNSGAVDVQDLLILLGNWG